MLYTLKEKIIIFLVALAIFIELLDVSALNTSLPQIAETFSLKTYDLSIVITIYLFALGVFIPLSGFCVTRFGSRNIFIASFVLFLCGSIGCGFSDSINQLIFFRFVQGIGGSFMLPIGKLIIARVFEQNLIPAMTIVTSIAMIGPIFGPIIGGCLTTFLGWQWIFFINIPFLLLGIILSYKYLINESVLTTIKFDLRGFIILFVGFGLFVFSTKAPINKHDLLYRLLIAFVGLCVIYMYVPYAKKSNNTLIDIHILNNETFKNLSLGNFIIRFSTGIVVFLIPIMLFEQHNYTSFQISFLMIPYILGALIIKPFITKILQQTNNKSILVINTYMLAASQCIFGVFIHKFIPVVFVCYVISVGILNTTQISLMNSYMYCSLSRKEKAQGNALYLSLSQLGTSIGITFSTFIFIIFHFLSIDFLSYDFVIAVITIITLIANIFFHRTQISHLGNFNESHL